MSMLKRLRRWLTQEPEASDRVTFYTADPPKAAKYEARLWTGAGSLTEQNILYHLQYGPMTRRQLDEVLDVTTAGLHLPRMVDRHQIRILPGTWPFRYERCNQEDSGALAVLVGNADSRSRVGTHQRPSHFRARRCKGPSR